MPFEYKAPPPKRTRRSSYYHEQAFPPTSRKDLQGRYRLISAKDVLKAVKERLEFKNKKQPLPGDKKHTAIVIAKNIDEAGQISELCTEIGFHQDKIKVMHSTEQKTPKEKEEAIQEIRNGNVEIVIIVKMLLEGLTTLLCIAGIVTGIRSPVKFAQFMAGFNACTEGGKEVGITG